jgi:hypothetical protein
MKEKRFCELCIDCDDDGCPGKHCHKEGPCVIADDCDEPCREGLGGFIGTIPIFNFDLKPEA